ncbi:MAG TPA: squalene/phytoene synthase family protein [Gemmatimonadaceae bacterium]
MIPFWLRRHTLLLRNLLANREKPDLAALARIQDAEDFVWAILPHAARTFSACIALMPRRTALPSAVAYLYCRMLDTYEDLVPVPREREASLRAFAARLSVTDAALAPAPPIETSTDSDERDRAHLLLVQRANSVDAVFVKFDQPTREIIRDLVRDMAEGMCWSSATFDAQGGVLTSDAQLATYCRHVLGNPTVFGIRILRLHYGQPLALTPAEREDAMLVGEFVQLANVTRDIEKDLRRGIAYDAALKPDLGRDASDPGVVRRCRDARERLLRIALARAGAYTRAINSIHMPTVAIARAAAVLMLLFTERYYRACARRVGLASWKGPDSTLSLIARSFAAAFSARLGTNEMERAERELLWAAAGS